MLMPKKGLNIQKHNNIKLYLSKEVSEGESLQASAQSEAHSFMN